MPNHALQVLVRVLVDGADVSESPFPVLVNPGPPHPQFCSATGRVWALPSVVVNVLSNDRFPRAVLSCPGPCSGAGLSKATAGQESEFTVLLKTKHGEAGAQFCHHVSIVSQAARINVLVSLLS